MGIIIQDPAIGKDAEAIAARHGISVEEAIGIALREKLAREQQAKSAKGKATYEELEAIAKHCAALPVLDNRGADEIPGHNKYGYFDEETLGQRKASYERARAIIEAYRALPLHDNRSADEILGYNEHGTLE